MDEYILKHLHDVLSAAKLIQSLYDEGPRRYDLFQNDWVKRSAVERQVEIMAEAFSRILKRDPSFPFPIAKVIIDMRNRIIPEYEKADPELLWGLVVRNAPQLVQEVGRLLDGEGTIQI